MGIIKKPTKAGLINLCLSLISIAGLFLVSYYFYRYIKDPLDQPIYRGENNEYSLSFYNQIGQRISGAEGMLKLMIDPFTIYTNYPNQKSHSYSINRYGFRDSFINKNVKTAIVIGGSAAFGFALNDNNKTFSSIVNRNNKEYELVNSAVVGYLSGQELAQMVHYLDRFLPVMYIVFNGWNDIYDPYVFTKEWPVNYGPIGYNNAFFMIERRLADYFQMTMKEKHSDVSNLHPPNEPLSESDYSHKIISTYISNIGKMNSFATARGAKFLLVFQPELGNKKILTEDEQETLNTWISKYGYAERKISERYKRFIDEAKRNFQKKNITYININDEPEFSENPRTLFFDVVHPNDLGHEVIAKIINSVLLEKF